MEALNRPGINRMPQKCEENLRFRSKHPDSATWQHVKPQVGGTGALGLEVDVSDFWWHFFSCLACFGPG